MFITIPVVDGAAWQARVFRGMGVGAEATLGRLPTIAVEVIQPMRTATFANGDPMPLLGLGTWKSAPGEVGAAVREAIRLGYRHIDCASVYANEPEVGAAIRGAIDAGEVSREELWITSKLWCNAHGRDNVEPALRRTLQDLRLEWLDLYLIHWPVPIKPGVAFPTSGDDLLQPEQVPLGSTWDPPGRAWKRPLSRASRAISA